MYTTTPNVSLYAKAVRQYRLPILLFFTLAAIVVLVLSRWHFLSSDTYFWLSSSKEMQKTHARHYETQLTSTLSVTVPVFDEVTKNTLLSLQTELQYHDDVKSVESLFSEYRIKAMGDNESGLVQAIPLYELDPKNIIAFVGMLPSAYTHLVSPDFKRFNFIINTDEPLDITRFTIPYPYTYSHANTTNTPNDYFLYLAIFSILIVIMSWVLFKSLIASLGAISVTALSGIFTLYSISALTHNAPMHITMLLMITSVSVAHYLYFYYRWHVSQIKSDPVYCIEKSINRNLKPALWSTPVLLFSLGSLLAVQSPIITMLSLSLILSSAFAYLLCLTFLPALLSYFTVKRPKIDFARPFYAFAKKESSYSSTLLRRFAATTAMAAVIIAVYINVYAFPLAHFNQHVITLKVPFERIDLATLDKLKVFETRLRHENPSVASVESINTVLSTLNEGNIPHSSMDEQRLYQALFFLQLYDMEQKYLDDDSLCITITLREGNNPQIISWIKNYTQLPLYFTDLDTLSHDSKIQSHWMLVSSLLVALVMIGIIVGIIFRSFKIGMIGIIANIVPMVWFGVFVVTFKLPLTIEALMAMTISVGLISDTIIHFSYTYFRSRHYGRSKKHALEVMFFYSAIPAVIGTFVLLCTFVLLMFSPIESLALIGQYGSILMLVSLITDIFILPVLLMAIDTNKR